MMNVNILKNMSFVIGFCRITAVLLRENSDKDAQNYSGSKFVDDMFPKIVQK